MKRSTAWMLLGVFVSGVGVLCATGEGRQWLTDVAEDQLDSVLETIAVTPEQRRAVQEVHSAVQAHLDARVEQLRSALRCIIGHSEKSHRLWLTLPPLGPLSELTGRPQRNWGWTVSHRPGAGYLPPPRGTVATEWRSCRTSAPR